MSIRQPIVVVMGHVDHGKTSLLDAIRSTNVAKKEAGAITQHIGASEVSMEDVESMCAGMAGGKKFTIPGLLFIDTPGHESFTHLRERGGSIADIAILVVDVAQGFQPQTVESIKILREFKTPFILAANKIDLISGWGKGARTEQKACGIVSRIGSQTPEVQTLLDEKIYSLVGKLSEMGIESERFDRISDFTKSVAIVPVSAKTGDGLPELLLFVAGLSQKFLESELKTEKETAGRGSILEVKEEKGLGTTMDVIIYDGKICKNDEIIFGTINGPAKTKVRGLLKPKLHRTGEEDKYEYVDEVYAAAGIKIYAPGLENALSGAPIVVDDGKTEKEEIDGMKKLIEGIIGESDKSGVILKADTLGSLEALRKLLSTRGLEVRRAGIGKVVKKDVIDASAVGASDLFRGVVLSFNVPTEDDASDEAVRRGIRIFSSNVIYALTDEYAEWIEAEKKKQSGSAMERLPMPAKILVLPGCTFRASKPAIFGVEVLAGRLRKGVRLMDRKGEVIGEIREMQKEGKGVKEAKAGEQLAISVEGAICGKNVCEGSEYTVYITKNEGAEIRASCMDELSDSEKAVLEEILAITDAKRI